MPNFPSEWMALLPRLSQEQQQILLASAQNAEDDESFNRELAKHPGLLAALQNIINFDQYGVPANLQNILRELSHPINNLCEMPRRIKLCCQALAIVDREENARLWGTLHKELATSLVRNPQESRADNMEQAIGHLEQALEVHTREVYPQDWAENQNDLAVIYNERIRGEKADNIERAITHFQKALEVLTRETYPELWAIVQNNLADAYRHRLRGERADNLERAIFHCEQALKVRTQHVCPENWAITHNILAAAYCERICGNLEKNREQAILHCQQALGVYTQQTYPERWAQTQHTLAGAYRIRVRGKRADNLDQAIICLKQALEIYTRQNYLEQWARVQNDLSVTYHQRICGEQADNLEQAIAYSEQALDVFTRQADPQQWAKIQHNLANIYGDRIRGRQADNLARAIIYYRQALEIRTLIQFPADYQLTQSSLGNLYFDKRADWARALMAYQESIRAETILLTEAYTETGQQAETAKTSNLYARAAYALLKLGRAEEALVQLDQGKTRSVCRTLALDELDFSLLSVVQQGTLRSLRQTLRTLESEIRLPPDTPARRDEHILVEALEQARSRLNKAIEIIRQDHPDFMPEGLKLGEILNIIPQNTVLVAPVVTSQGSAIFVIPAGALSVTSDHVIWMEDFKWVDLTSMVWQKPVSGAEWGGWLGAYINANIDAKTWFETIETTGQIMWDRLMGPIAQRLTYLDGHHVLLMLQGILGLLPVHAAWRDVAGVRRYFIDDYAISYIPSVYAQRVGQERMRNARRREHSLLAVINPTDDLPFAPVEGEQLACIFGRRNSVILSGNKATSQAVKDADATYLHFACHGFYHWGEPMQSGLVLAKSEKFTLSQIISVLHLDNTRLVTLSACETGIIDIRQSPDEYLGLPAGFLQAGAPAVVSTLWAVNDLSTMLLMEHFYKLHLQQEQDPPHALQQAQIWLRNLTAGELAQRFADAEEALLLQTNAHLPQEMVSTYFARFASQDRANRPFAHPYYWAAFTFSGA